MEEVDVQRVTTQWWHGVTNVTLVTIERTKGGGGGREEEEDHFSLCSSTRYETPHQSLKPCCCAGT